jgi:hypothetical protein
MIPKIIKDIMISGMIFSFLLFSLIDKNNNNHNIEVNN